MIIRFENKCERYVFTAVVLAAAAVAVLCGFAISQAVAANCAARTTASGIVQ